MRVLRAKQIRKALKFYRIAYGITEPYQILLDGNFIVIAFQMKLDIKSRLPKFLQADKYKLLTTRCVVNEMEQLGTAFEKAVVFAREECKIKNCGHKEPLAANECLLSLIGNDNPEKLFVGTQDEELRGSLRSVPGTPLFYMNRAVLVFEQPSQATKEASEKKEQQKLAPAKSIEKKLLDEAKKDEAPATPVTPKSRLKRKAHGPNPLSCKKKKIKTSGEEGNGQPGSENGQDGALAGKKRKRKRKKGKKTTDATA